MSYYSYFTQSKVFYRAEFQVNIQKYKEIIYEHGYDPDFEDNVEELDEEYIDRILSLFKSNNIKKHI